MIKSLSLLNKSLKNLKRKNLYRSLKIPSKSLIDFCSNDYLNFSKNLNLKNQIISSLKRNRSLGAGSSRLIRGNTLAHQEIEKDLSAFVKRESALIFSSGYLANVGLLSALCKGAKVFSDELNHASLIDGIRLSGEKPFIYSHNSLKDLEKKIKTQSSLTKKVIVTESLFSMDGDLAPLMELLWLSKKYQAFLYIDEAHTTGVFGEKGGGRLAQIIEDTPNFFKIFSNSLILSLHTFGKSLGLSGAFIACSKTLKKFFINHCRTFIYTTGVPPLLILSWKLSLKILKKEIHKKKLLEKNSLFFREALKEIGLSTPSRSQIIPILLGSSQKALFWEKYLKHKGFDVRAIRYPTVPKGKARLRICIHANHKKKDMLSLLKNLKTLKSNNDNKNKKIKKKQSSEKK